MDAQSWLLVAGAAVAGFVQGLSGFAFAMVALSIWVWGVPPQLAAVMAVFGALTGQVVQALASRRSLRWPLLWPFLAGGVVGVPLGVAVLPHLNADHFKLVLGLLLVLWCPAMLLSGRLPRLAWGGRGADALIGAVGGVMGGIGGSTGAVPTLWCTLRGFDKDTQRAVIQNFNLAALAFTMLGYLVAGTVTRQMLPQMALVAPALLLPSLLGSRLYTGLSDLAFRRLVLVLLTCSGAAMLAAALPRLLAR